MRYQILIIGLLLNCGYLQGQSTQNALPLNPQKNSSLIQETNIEKPELVPVSPELLNENELTLEVKNLLISRKWWPWLLLKVLILILLIKFWRRKKSVVVSEPLNTRYLRQLDELKTLINQEKLVQFSIEVANLQRHYIAERFAIPTSSETSKEFLDFIISKEIAVLKPYQQELQNFMNCMDLIKFAKAEIDAPQCLHLYQTAKDFIETTKEAVTNV